MFSFGAGVYADYMHNHQTYTTLAGKTKNIFKANGAIRSARAAEFASTSRFVRGLGIIGGAASTLYSGAKVVSQYNNGGINNINSLDVADTVVGVVGLITTGLVATSLVVASPVTVAIGIGVTVYFGARLTYDLYNTISN